MTIMWKGLSPPHIQLGFIWNDCREVDHYGDLLAWLLRHGHAVGQQALMAKTESGRAPWFSQLAMDSSAVAEGGMFWRDADALEAIPAERDAVPILTRLTAVGAEGIDCDLGYALSFERDDLRAIEIVASGMELNLRDAAGTEALTPRGRAVADQSEQWIARVFRGVCEELEPCYAARYWERALLSPTVLVLSEDVRDWTDLFLSDALLSGSPCLERFDTLRVCSVSSWKTGKFVELTQEPTEYEHECDIVVSTLCSLFRSRFPGKRCAGG